jgi:P27 family predicted phage terminase small subunit
MSRQPKVIPLPARPEPEGPPDPPPFLEGDALVEWHRVAPSLWRSGRLRPVDVGALSAYCREWARWKGAEEAIAAEAAKGALNSAFSDDGLIGYTQNGKPRPNPLLATSARAARQMVRIAAAFGMTPASRSALGNLAAHR